MIPGAFDYNRATVGGNLAHADHVLTDVDRPEDYAALGEILTGV